MLFIKIKLLNIYFLKNTTFAHFAPPFPWGQAFAVNYYGKLLSDYILGEL